MDSYRAIIIEDEKEAREFLTELIKHYCPKVVVSCFASTCEEARELLEEFPIDIMFLDISLNDANGIDFLYTLRREEYGVIFTTAYHEFAIRALRTNSIDFLLKPIVPEELIVAVDKAIHYYNARQSDLEIRRIYEESFANLRENLRTGVLQQNNITINEPNGFKRAPIIEIMYLVADSNYTTIYMKGGDKFVSTHNLGEFEVLIDNPSFFRIHKSTLINIIYVSGYSSYEGFFVEMKDGQKLDISRRKVIEFKNWVKAYSLSFE